MNYIREYLEEIEAEGKSKQTVKAGENTMMMFYRWKLNNNTLTVDDISNEEILSTTTDDIRKYKLYMSKIYKPTGANTKLRYIKMFCDWCKKVRIVDVSIYDGIDVFTEPKRKPMAMEEEEVGLLLDYLRKQKTIHGRRDYVAIMTMLSSGVRISELLSITPKKIFVEKMEDGNLYGLDIIGKGNKERDTILTEKTYKALQDYILRNNIGENELIFNVEARTIEKNLKKYLKAVGLSDKYTPHKLRHTFATLLYENDVQIEEISKYLGHESTSTTTNFYVKISDKQKRKASRIHPMNKF